LIGFQSVYIRKAYSDSLHRKGDILGNIRQTYIKNIAIDLTKKYPNQFKHDDFQNNKLKVAELTDVSSILLRNRIAGYITRHLASKQKTAD
jgi:small subunit ribosomal protein S17e